MRQLTTCAISKLHHHLHRASARIGPSNKHSCFLDSSNDSNVYLLIIFFPRIYCLHPDQRCFVQNKCVTRRIWNFTNNKQPWSSRARVKEKPNRFDGFLNWKGKLNGCWRDSKSWQIETFSHNINFSLLRLCDMRSMASSGHRQNAMKMFFCCRQLEKFGWDEKFINWRPHDRFDIFKFIHTARLFGRLAAGFLISFDNVRWTSRMFDRERWHIGQFTIFCRLPHDDIDWILTTLLTTELTTPFTRRVRVLCLISLLGRLCAVCHEAKSGQWAIGYYYWIHRFAWMASLSGNQTTTCTRTMRIIAELERLALLLFWVAKQFGVDVMAIDAKSCCLFSFFLQNSREGSQLNCVISRARQMLEVCMKCTLSVWIWNLKSTLLKLNVFIFMLIFTFSHSS